MKQIPASLLTLTAGILVTIISIWVGQHHGLLPEQASEQAPLVDNFFNLMVTIATALFLVVEGAILIFAIQFRQRRGDNTDGPPIEGNFSLEIFWTAIPAIIVITIGMYSVEVFRDMGGFVSSPTMAMSHVHSASSAIAAPLVAEAEATGSSPIYGFGASPTMGGKAPDLEVDVTGLQYAWLFNYPSSGIVAGELHVPVGQDVQLNLQATDVIHSFWVPQFRLKQDAIPGQHTELRFKATKVGTYPVVCTELCGSYHGAMRTQVVVETPESYESWVAANQIAQSSNLESAIALHLEATPAADFLAPYTQDLGVNPTVLAQLQPHHS